MKIKIFTLLLLLITALNFRTTENELGSDDGNNNNPLPEAKPP